MRIRGIGIGAALVLLAGMSGMALADSADRTSEQVVKHHFDAIAAGDLDAIVGDFAEDAVVISATGVVRGKDAVRKTFARLAHGAPRGARTAGATAAPRGLQIVLSHYTHDVGWVIWEQNAGKPNEVRGVETYLIRGGKIELETVGIVAVHPAGAALPKQ